MFEIGPIGCMPSSRRRQFKHNGTCVEEINELAQMFNNMLAPMLLNLTSTLHASSFIIAHAHALGYDVITNPSNYGKIKISIYKLQFLLLFSYKLQHVLFF